MTTTLISNANILNEGIRQSGDLLIKNGRIEQIGGQIAAPAGAEVIDAQGKLLMPGMIDDQVHFREPGLTQKGSMATESRAAVAGGITSFMEMPNVNPQTTNIEALQAKFARAAEVSVANHSFYLGATNDNLEQIKALDPNAACGIKIFMGASTGNMLVDNEETLAGIFANAPIPVATHCEDSPMIAQLEEQARAKYGEAVPMQMHANIRSREACIKSTKTAMELARRYGTRLHVLHISTAEELALFEAHKKLSSLATANITAEACVHHLFYSEQDYLTLGSQIKCNPSVKTERDRLALLDAVRRDVIDIIATDHAPHTWEEKQGTYFKAPSGVPLVQHALQSLFEHYHEGALSLETIVQKTSHAVAERFNLKDRGYLREGYHADLVLVDLDKPYPVNKQNLLYKCNWSSFENTVMRSTISSTWVGGHRVFDGSHASSEAVGQALTFNR
ncbi:dihydroorotase [Ferrimonas lipolytica]|uniref:Dihydroorotase n=1 Tax=Ferrimonas lipolytica TaxID=2724191 RepID=A0A6H1UF00_9GAMM|nr:dihydroorotase [Ferrimonas lipolytica]QIZ76372.1 dihydroorotase [Ferrimonas lipolytica]